MRVLHLIDSAGLYGAEKVMLALAQEQTRLGSEVRIGSIGAPGLDKPIETAARTLGLTTARIEMSPGLRPGNIGRLAGVLKTWPCDVVHTHGYKPNVLMAGLRGVGDRPTHVVTLHGWTSHGRWTRNRIYESLDRSLLRFADAVVIVSERMRFMFDNSALRRAIYVPNGIPAMPIHADPIPANIAAFCAAAPTIVCVGRLAVEKDYATVLRALTQPDVDRTLRLLLIGEGALRGDLETLCTQLGLRERTMFAGYLDDAWRVFPYCRALVVSSLTEGLPITLLEAMRSGLPIVTTPVGDIEAATAGDRGAWYFPPGRERELAGKLAQVLGADGPARQRAVFSQERCRQTFSIEQAAAAYDAVYQRSFSSKLKAELR